MSGSSRFGIACLAISFSFLCCMREAKAVDLIDTLNLNGTFTTGGNNTSTPGDMLAQSFTADVAGFVVTEIDLKLFRGDGELGSYSVYIYSSTGTGNNLVPDTAVATIFTGQSFVSGDYPIPVTSTADGSDTTPIAITGLNILLNPTETYFIVAAYNTGSFSLNWAANNWTTTNPNPSTFTGNPSYFVLYDSIIPLWANFGPDQPSAMKVVARVPEPSTWALGALAAAGIVATSRRRSQA